MTRECKGEMKLVMLNSLPDGMPARAWYHKDNTPAFILPGKLETGTGLRFPLGHVKGLACWAPDCVPLCQDSTL